ncbi:hypothetical protein R273_23590 [Salmonella enterica]|uniref:Tn3 transposase DDE domain-containing protein n=1 Tax=Salmonella enterica I TaxID=59201 RepID=A0A5Y3IC06_SALET|nr:hypothetical protein [Salmonella enterica]EBV4333449.1 hypothetical protein [Salmonella enterica subsp. enterica serovar Caracas]ECE0047570.1 hypothetical protein [Salmonella enterica subsp. enterica]ECE0798184.1 hypothetical protein [Salmonella enterica subsp. enterica serovar Onderstepoort]ECI0234613.1 hypothetical protein [Salmonella enterica subsp. enterica serovar Bahrenfeld]ECT8341409.1 hypothetical protein [Salmonella enterica subsp. enterica serovar Anatum]
MSFDIWYRNTSAVKHGAITGEMHSINKANFAILHWFGLRFEPHFTDLSRQLAGRKQITTSLKMPCGWSVWVVKTGCSSVLTMVVSGEHCCTA